jgi:RES domain-containing protein
MSFTALDQIVAYRMHTPKWAVTPTSGAGAAAYGGRANRPGIAALYLSLDSETAVREYQQVSMLLPPGTLVSYHVTATPIVDFRHGYHPAQWSPLWEEFFCDLRKLWFNQRVEPPSWVLADEAVAAGAKGILFPTRLPPPAQTSLFTPSCWAQLMASWSMIQPAHCPRTRIPGPNSRA